MKILFVIAAFNVGGTETKLKKVANYLVSNDLADVDILCLSEHTSLSSELLPEIGFHSFSSSMGRYSWFTLKRNIKQYLFENPDYDKIFWLNYFPAAAAMPNRAYQVAMINSTNVYGIPGKIKKFIAERNYSFFDSVVFGNESLASLVRKSFPSYKDKVKVIYNGVDVNSYNYLVDYPKASEFVLVMVSKIRPEKRHIEAIKALHILRNRGLNVSLKLVGGRHISFNDYYESVFKLIDELNLNDAIKFVGETDNVSAELQSSTLFVLPSHETFSNALLEAMACGIPAITANIGGSLEVIEDGVTGFHFKYMDEVDLAEKAYNCLSNFQILNSVRSNARKKIEDSFHFDVMAKKYLDI